MEPQSWKWSSYRETAEWPGKNSKHRSDPRAIRQVTAQAEEAVPELVRDGAARRP